MELNRSALTVVAASAFVYVTAETIPVGLLPQISEDLHVTEANVGLLLTSYAVVAGVTTIPLTALTMRIPRHRLIAAMVAIFAVSQLAAAFAPTFALLVLARLVCALAHGIFWSAIGPVTARLAPPGQAGKATALAFLGNSLAIVLGVPLGTLLGQHLGWRVTIAVLAAAGAICVVALLLVLPDLPVLPRDRTTPMATQLKSAVTIIRHRPVARLCLVTATLVIGHFAAYTYITPLVRRDGDIQGTPLSLLLLGYGAVGLLANFIVGRLVDRRPAPVLTTLLLTMTVSVAALAPVLGPTPTILATLIWGGAFTAIPVCLAAGVLRVAPRSRDAASALYVVAFQIGIGGGAFAGERLVTGGHLGWLPIAAAALALAAGLMVLTAKDAFPRHITEDDYRAAEAATAP